MAELERRTAQSGHRREGRAAAHERWPTLDAGQTPATAESRCGAGPTAARPIAGSPATNGRSLRADTPLTLTSDDLARLRALNDPISLEEVIAIYLPLSRLLALYVAATQGLFKATQRFLGAEDGKVPYIIGVAGSVAVGKSTTARVLRALLSRWPNTPKVDLVTTDGFLLPNAVLERAGPHGPQGLPRELRRRRAAALPADVKAGQAQVAAPVYSHLVYDIVPDEAVIVDRPDILIVEGLNVLQPARLPRDGTAIPFVSDFFDFSIYLDADEDDPAATGTSSASCACARPPSAIRAPTSADTPS